MIGLVDSYTVAGREAEAIKLSEEAMGKLKATFGSTHAHTLDHMKRLARLLLTANAPNLRNPVRATELAKKLTEANPGDGKHWHLLGAAHYRSSNWQSAVDALSKAMEIHKDGDAFDWLYLGMAHWQLGNKTEARRRYDGIANWMDKHDQKNDSLNRLRAEAAELLGVNENK